MLHAVQQKPCSGPSTTISAPGCTAQSVTTLLWNSKVEARCYRGRLGPGVGAFIAAANGERLIELVYCEALRVLHVLRHH
jgi:hypothetical protein